MGAQMKPTKVPRAKVSGEDARFRWERALRADLSVPRHLKGFLLLVGTYMSNNGCGAVPRVRTLAEQFTLSSSRVFELLAEAENRGWIHTRKRPGKSSERRPAIPTPPAGSGGVPLPLDLEGSDLTPPAGSDLTPPAGSDLTPPAGSDPTRAATGTATSTAAREPSSPVDNFDALALGRRLDIEPAAAAAIIAEIQRRRAPRNLNGYLRSIPDAELLDYLAATAGTSTRPALQPPCGQCDARPTDPPSARMVLDPDSGQPRPCPLCHPSALEASHHQTAGVVVEIPERRRAPTVEREEVP